MNPRTIVARNCPGSPQYDDSSFTAILHEQGMWQRDQYWLLEWALYDLISKAESGQELCGPVFRIFSYVMSAIISSFDQNDLFEIKNLKHEELYEFRERTQIIFEAFFARRMPERVAFDEVNPLLPRTNAGSIDDKSGG